MRTRVVYGLSGPTLLAEERSFFTEAQPFGFIVFARNIVDRTQVRRLTDSLRDAMGDANVPILIDQEGGRVARMKPPQWRAAPAAARFGALAATSVERAREATYLNARLVAYDLCEAGINVNCVPVLDVPVEGADSVIGERAFARDPLTVIELGRVAIDGYLDGGVLPVMKHAPGHGRATADSHKLLPRVGASREELSATDFVTFRSLNHCPMAMTGHVVFEAIDPQRPATTSPKVVRDVIRGEIGFEGLLFTDDLSMEALAGSLAARAKAAQFAGCDIVVHCTGKLEEMREVAGEIKPLDDVHRHRADAALKHLEPPEDFDAARGVVRLSELLGETA